MTCDWVRCVKIVQCRGLKAEDVHIQSIGADDEGRGKHEEGT